MSCPDKTLDLKEEQRLEDKKEKSSSTNAILEEIDSEENIDNNNNSKWLNYLIDAICLACAAFHIYTSGFGLLEVIKQRSIHLAFMLILCYLLYPASKKKRGSKTSVLDICLAILAGFSALFVIIFYDEFVWSFGISSLKFQIMFVVLTILILEATRRAVAKELVFIALAFLAYGWFGNYFPGIFKVAGGSLARFTDYLYMIPEGIFGTCLGTSANYIILFVVFGSLMEKSGMGQLIQDCAMALTGRAVGGPAKIAVLSSALFGTVSGSAAANVVTTGAFTIPLMKKIGYEPEFAGAVEAASSTGGQIVPPVMGAAAFLMADMLGLNYSTVMFAAILPALLYYISIFITVDIRARKLGLRGLTKEECPRIKDVLKERGHMFIPFIIVITMICMRFSPIYAGFWGIVSTVAFSSLKKSTRMTIREILDACILGVKRSVSVAVACACVGFIVGISTLTGIGTILGNQMVALSGGNLLVLGIIVAFVSIILGMGLPATGVYVVTVAVCVPAMIQLGIPALAAHFFPFYFGIYASITPPVCLAAFAAAGLANASPSKTGYQAFRIAIPGMLIPFIFIISPALLFLDGTTFIQTLQTFLSALFGTFSIAASVEGWFLLPMPIHLRVLLFAGGFMMMVPGTVTDIVGLALMAICLVLQIMRKCYQNRRAD